jgi:hypothetical protein
MEPWVNLDRVYEPLFGLLADAYPEKGRYARTDQGLRMALQELGVQDAIVNDLSRCLSDARVRGCLRAPHMPTEFVVAFRRIRAFPYDCSFCGETRSRSENPDPDTCLRLRDAIHGIVNGAAVNESKGCVDRSRLRFALWCIWKSRDFRARIYSGKVPIKLALNRLGYRFKDAAAAGAVHQNRRVPGLWAPHHLRKRELSVIRMLDGAVALARGMEHRCGPLDGLDAGQAEAVRRIIASPWSMLQGGAGVGKSHTAAALLRAVSACVPDAVALCLAPTHKAARVLQDKLSKLGAAGSRVRTIHSAAGRLHAEADAMSSSSVDSSVTSPETMDESYWKRSVFILVDEASMVSLSVLAWLADGLSRVKCTYQLVFVGDMNQLPPVSRGEVYRWLLENRGVSRTSHLTTCHRCDVSGLLTACNDVSDGIMCMQPAGSSEGFELAPCPWGACGAADQDESVVASVKQGLDVAAFARRSAAMIAFKNETAARMNALVQAEMHAHGATGDVAIVFKVAAGKPAPCLRVGDPVVWNDDPKGPLTKGTTGVVLSGDGRSACLVKWELSGDDPFVTRVISGTGSLQMAAKSSRRRGGPAGGSTDVHDPFGTCVRLSYCLTGHKAQGSEFDRVTIVLLDGDLKALGWHMDRRWLYTAMTRARRRAKLYYAELNETMIEEYIRKPVGQMMPMDLDTAGS